MLLTQQFSVRHYEITVTIAKARALESQSIPVRYFPKNVALMKAYAASIRHVAGVLKGNREYDPNQNQGRHRSDR